MPHTPSLAREAARSAREATGGLGLGGLRRLFDRRPLQCSFYVTDRCNLDCAYCTEYDNTRAHPPAAELRAWIHKVRELGTLRIALVGGEPLLHPEIVELVRYSRQLGLATSITTNGFLLTPELVRGLEEAGLQTMQVSVDRMTPGPLTRKSLKTLRPRLELLRGSRFAVHLTGVLCADTLPEARAVLDAGLDSGLPTELRLVHAGPDGRFGVEPGDRAALASVLGEMIERKRRGQRIHTSETLLRYQLAQLEGSRVPWTCSAGYKIFFVSARGEFWLCSQVRTAKPILEVTPEDLLAHDRPKPCQDGCGVYCVISASLITQQPLAVVAREALSRGRAVLGRALGPAPAGVGAANGRG